MAGDTRPTTFVTGAAGFIGTELVKVLVARGHRVFGLARSLDEAERVRRADAVFANIRPRGIGFSFRYPTIEQGFQQVLGALHE